MSPLPEAFERLRKKNPGALALAERAALAAWVEPELLRALRLDTLRGIGAAAEADLWFSELVSARSASALVLRTEYLEQLRQWVSTAPGEFGRAVQVIRRMHARSPELIQREERLIAGALAGTLSEGDIQKLLFEALGTLLEDPNPARRDAVASWALGAWPRLPSGVRYSSAGLQLLLAANQRRGGYLAAPSISLPDATLESFYKGLLGSQQRRAYVEVVWHGEELILRQVQAAGPATVEVPGTMPVVVEVASEQRRSLVLLRAQEPGRAKVEGDAITLRTLDARSYRVIRPLSEPSQELEKTPAGAWRWSRKWIAVVGTGAGKITEKLRNVAIALGKGLAREGHGLVIGGWPGIDEIVDSAYSEELLRLGGEPRTYVSVMRDLTGDGAGREGSSGKKRRQPRFTEPAFHSDALILLGGESGVWRIFGAAQDMGRPVLPLPATGGSAERAFDALLNASELRPEWFSPPSAYTLEDLRRLGVPLESRPEIQQAVTVVLKLLEQAPIQVQLYAEALLMIMATEFQEEEEDEPSRTLLFRQLVRETGRQPVMRGEVARFFEALRGALASGAYARLEGVMPSMSARLLEDFQQLRELGELGLRVQATLARRLVESNGRAGLEAIGRVASRHRLGLTQPAVRRLLEGARVGFVSEEKFRSWVADKIKLSWTEYTFRESVERLGRSFKAGTGEELLREFHRENEESYDPDYVRYYLSTRRPPGQRAMAYLIAREHHFTKLFDRLLGLLPDEQEQFLNSRSAVPLAQFLEALQFLGLSQHLRTRAGRKTRQELEKFRNTIAHTKVSSAGDHALILDQCNRILAVDEPAPSGLTQPSREFQEQLHRALLSAYPSRRELKRLILLGLGLRPENWVSKGSLAHVVSAVVDRAVIEGRFKKLVIKAFEGRPGNPLLNDLYNEVMDATPKQAVDIGATEPTASKPATASEPKSTPKSEPATATEPAMQEARFSVPQNNLQRGMQGPEVAQLQTALVDLGYMTQAQKDTGPGIFGPQTEVSLKRFQADHGVPSTGHYGPLTREALTRKAGGVSSPGPVQPHSRAGR